MQLPKFSVITVSLNQGEFIRDTIESVLAQGYENFEHIVIDGGSTDATLSILREYPHLTWVSEPDRGQSHALNKGLSRATGDVIAWINSDDWYAPGAFNAVAHEIAEYPVVMGRCSFVDRAGALKEDVANVERTWFDTLKYWVYHASPAQPSIFFKRHVLDELFISRESALDEGLYFTMDFDLWLRIQERYPLMRRIDKTLSFFRVYEANKTGADMASTYREFSRVFRRHSARAIQQEQSFAFVAPVERSCEELEPFVASLATTLGGPLECIVVDQLADRSDSRRVMKEVLQLGARYPKIAFQHRRIPDGLERSRRRALDVGISAAHSPLVAYVDPKRAVPSDFVLKAELLFNQDNIGFLFTSLDDVVKGRLFSKGSGQIGFNPLGPLGCRIGDPEFVMRTIAARDVEGFRNSDVIGDADDYALKRLLLMLTHKAWIVTAHDLLSPRRVMSAPLLPEAFRLYCNSLLIADLVHELEQSAFARWRERSRFALAVPEPLRKAAFGVLSGIPQDTRLVSTQLSPEELEQIAQRYPHFGPASYLIAELLSGQGRSDDARVWHDRWRTLHAQEQHSPLYSA